MMILKAICSVQNNTAIIKCRKFWRMWENYEGFLYPGIKPGTGQI
jgi:hypothetical protein